MERIAIDGGPKWFDLDKATYYTGVNTPHPLQRLYRSSGGTWILNIFSRYSEGPETYTHLTPAAAAQWLTATGHEPTKDLVDIVAAEEV